MMLRLIAASVVVAAPLTFAVGYWQGRHMADVPAASVLRLNPPLVTKPGYGAAAAGKYFAVLNTPPPPPLPPALLPPDVGATFRREVTGVLLDKTPHVILTDGRQLARGQDYRDGWKVREVSTEAVTLAKGRETRSINLFSAPPAPAGPTGPQPVNFGPISLTNGQQSGKLSAGVINRIVQALRAIGLGQAQLDQLQRQLTASGGLNPGQGAQMINTAVRGRQVTRAQLNNLVQAFVAAGAIPAGQADATVRNLLFQQQNQQLQGILNGRGFPAGPGGGFNGGGRRGGRGGLGLTAPNVSNGAQLGQAPPQVVLPADQTIRSLPDRAANP